MTYVALPELKEDLLHEMIGMFLSSSLRSPRQKTQALESPESPITPPSNPSKLHFKDGTSSKKAQRKARDPVEGLGFWVSVSV